MQLLGRLEARRDGAAGGGQLLALVKFVRAAIEDEASAKRMATQFRNGAAVADCRH